MKITRLAIIFLSSIGVSLFSGEDPHNPDKEIRYTEWRVGINKPGGLWEDAVLVAVHPMGTKNIIRIERA